MKVLYFSISFAVSAALISGCVFGNKGRSDVPAVVDTVTDSLVVDDEYGYFNLLVEYPKDKNLVLREIIGEYISEELGGEYSKDFSDIKSVAKYYFDDNVKELCDMYEKYEEDPSMKYHHASSFYVYDEGPGYITYMYTSEVYTGGAHGSYYRSGMTFRKSDGRRIGWDILKKRYDSEFNELLKTGLKDFFEVKSDEELEGYLMGVDGLYSIPLPETPPVFTKEGVEFIYNQYEIAAYAAGSPSFTISYDDIDDYLMYSAKKMLGIE